MPLNGTAGFLVGCMFEALTVVLAVAAAAMSRAVLKEGLHRVMLLFCAHIPPSERGAK
jgi:hypothetical protein